MTKGEGERIGRGRRGGREGGEEAGGGGGGGRGEEERGGRGGKGVGRTVTNRHCKLQSESIIQ